jgi:hypothetical protein
MDNSAGGKREHFIRYVYNLKAATTYQWRILTRCKITPDTILSVYADGPEFTTLAAAVASSPSIESISRSADKIYPVLQKILPHLISVK